MSDELPEPLPHRRYAHLAVETEYERVFRDHVLEPLAEISAWTVESQKSVTVSGRTYRIDFSLCRNASRIAVEVDGAAKGPGGPTHDDWTRRQTALVNDGWDLLRFTNGQVMHEQEYCRRQVAVAVARLQEKATPPRTATDAAPALAVRAAPGATRAHTSRSRVGALVAGLGALLVAAVVVVIVLIGGKSASNKDDPPAGSDRYPCPASSPVKGNISASGEKIYHQPGDYFYGRTQAEQCFPNPTAAEAAGFRAAKR